MCPLFRRLKPDQRLEKRRLGEAGRCGEQVGAVDPARHPGGTIVCVSHADPIKALVAHAVGTHLDLFQRIVISPCSVTVVTYSPAGPTVLAVNSMGDLAGLRAS